MSDSHRRSLLKGVTWRIVASTTTMVIVFIATGNLVLVIGVGMADVTLKIMFYYLHERLWGRVRWGRIGVVPFCTPVEGDGTSNVGRSDKNESRDQPL